MSRQKNRPPVFQHAFKQHVTAKRKGNIDLTEQDFLNIPDYIDSYDDILEFRTFKNGDREVVIGKKINGYSVIVELLSNKRKSLHFKNMWGLDTDTYEDRYGKSTASHPGRSSDVANDPTGVYHSAFSDPIIPQTPSGVKGQFAQDGDLLFQAMLDSLKDSTLEGAEGQPVQGDDLLFQTMLDMLDQEKVLKQAEALEKKSSSQMDTSDGIMAEIRNSIKGGRIRGEGRKEDRSSFISRLSDEGYAVRYSETEGEGRAAAFGYRDIYPQGRTGEVRQGLNKFGIPSFGMDGTLWQNQNGVSRLLTVSDAAAIPGVGVFINAKTTISPMRIVGHEAYHFWKGTEAREVYSEILQDNLDFASQAFRDYFDTFDQFYFDDGVDISDAEQMALFQEELFAYISGDLHEGTKDTQLAPMFRDFNAVKAAWETLVRENQKG